MRLPDTLSRSFEPRRQSALGLDRSARIRRRRYMPTLTSQEPFVSQREQPASQGRRFIPFADDRLHKWSRPRQGTLRVVASPVVATVARPPSVPDCLTGRLRPDALHQ